LVGQFTRLIATLFIGCAVITGCQAENSSKIKDLPVDTFDPDLKVMESYSIPYWITNDLVVVSAMQKGVKLTFPEANTPARVVLLNFKTKSMETIVEDGSIVYFDRYSKKFMTAIRRLSDLPDSRQGASAKKAIYSNLKEMHINAEGKAVVDRELPEGSEPPNTRPDVAFGSIWQPLGHPKDGYLIQQIKEGDTLQSQEDRHRRLGEPLPTVWIRPDQPPVNLPMSFDEVTDGEYLEFLDKFQLNRADSAMGSDTNQAMSVTRWSRPYSLTPYRLLSKDGQVEEIPYPDFIQKFGLKERSAGDGGGFNFSFLLVTRPGLLINKFIPGGDDFFLYEHSKLFRLIIHRTAVTSPLFRSHPTRIMFHALSPDGCKLAYTHLRDSNVSATWASNFYLTIINLCTTGS